MTDWEKVVAATEGHNLEQVDVRLTEGGPWVYTQCSCYPASETFTEPWEFTDHIRRIVFEAIRPTEG